MKLYSILATIFYLIRQFAMPNPFDALGEGLTIYIAESPLVLSPELLNWIADPITFSITFAIVGLYYARGSEPAVGSILYMFFYAVHIGLLYLVLSVYPMVWLMVIIGLLYVGLHIGAIILKAKADYF